MWVTTHLFALWCHVTQFLRLLIWHSLNRPCQQAIFMLCFDEATALWVVNVLKESEWGDIYCCSSALK